MKHITLRMDEELHKKLKLKLVHEDTSIQKYIIALIEKDMMEVKED